MSHLPDCGFKYSKPTVNGREQSLPSSMVPKANQALYKEQARLVTCVPRPRSKGGPSTPNDARGVHIEDDNCKNQGIFSGIQVRSYQQSIGDLQPKKGMKMEKMIIQLPGSVRSNKAIALKDQPTQKDKSEEK